MDIFDKMQKLSADMGVRILYKDQSRLMKVLGALSKPFNPRFSTHYTTTLGSTVYFPSEAFVQGNAQRAAQILAHELVHVQDQRDFGTFRYLGMYARPQVFAVGAVLATLAIPFSLCWLVNLLWLLALAPWPSKGRAHIEYRGYAMSMACLHWSGNNLAVPPDSIVKNFTGMAYFRMNPNEDAVRIELQDWLNACKNGTLATRIPLARQIEPIFSGKS